MHTWFRISRRRGGRFFEAAWFKNPIRLQTECWLAVLAVGPFSLILCGSLHAAPSTLGVGKWSW